MNLMLSMEDEMICLDDTTDEIPPICCYADLGACCFGGNGPLAGYCFTEGETEDDFVLADCSGLDAAPES
jgi:hypothetical protein